MLCERSVTRQPDLKNVNNPPPRKYESYKSLPALGYYLLYVCRKIFIVVIMGRLLDGKTYFDLFPKLEFDLF